MNRPRLASGLLVMALAVGSLGLAGVSAADDSPTPATTSTADAATTFTVGIQGDIDSLNPFSMISASAYELTALVYDSLTGNGPSFEATPILAKDLPTVSDDGLTWTYTLRDGVTFSDGKPLTSADVAYTVNRIRDGSYEKTNWGSYVKNITDVKTPDPQTVVFVTKKPAPQLNIFAVPILPEHIWKNIDGKEVRTYTNEPDLPGGAVGSGPFILTEAKNNQFYTLKRNPNYWGTPPSITQVTYRVFKNGEAEALALRNGEIDFAADLDANVFQALEGVDNIATVKSVYSQFNYITMNTGATTVDGKPIGDGNPALKDPVVRQAISLATDRQTLVDRVLQGDGNVGTTIIPPIYQPFHLDPANPTPFDIDQANQLLDDAGYTKGPDGIRTMPAGGPDAGKPLELRLWGRQESNDSKKTVQFMAPWLKQIGIKADVKIVSEDFLYEAAGQGDYDMYEWDWIVEPDPDYQLSTMTCEQRSSEVGGTVYAGLNDSFFCDKQYDQLYQEQSTEIDTAKRQDLVKQMQQIVYDQNPYIVWSYNSYLQAYRTDRWTDFVAQPPPDGALLFQWGIWSYLSIKPVTADTSSSSGGGSSVGLIVGVIALIVVVGVIAFVVGRRRTRTEDTE
jgi:peptide/nickel transport system substrate-binding protein